MRPHAGFISLFQKMGTVSRGGLRQSRSELRGTNRTRPPAANFCSASSQDWVMRMSGERERTQSGSRGKSSLEASAPGYNQKSHSFSKYVAPRLTFGPGRIFRSTEL